MTDRNSAAGRLTIGIDVGDTHCHVCVLDASGEVVEESKIRTTLAAVRGRFSGLDSARIALETGTHSNWIADELRKLDHEVLVANARKLQVISQNDRKNDRTDAELLARLARADPKLLSPVEPRSSSVRRDLELIRSRSALVEARTKLVNHARGLAKSAGSRLRGCSAESFHKLELPEELRAALQPLLRVMETITAQVRAFDKEVERLGRDKYPQTALLKQVDGVGPLTSLCFVLTLDDESRFKKSRDVGAYVGLVPRRAQSGASDPKLRITKAGDGMLRSLLIQSAHYILGPFGPDCDLRRLGERILQSNGKYPKRRAVVAVARKLAVVLHQLWRSAEVYDPLRTASQHQRRRGRRTAAANASTEQPRPPSDTAQERVA
jgi:transposase